MGMLAKMTTETNVHKLTSYAFNPVYINSCRHVPLEIYVAFKEDMDKVIPLWMKVNFTEALRNQEKSETDETKSA